MAAKAKVLVVDDDPDCRQFVEAVLEADLPADIWQAENGEAGLRLARTRQPDLIVLDVMMPVKDGYDTFLALRDDPATAKIPVIMLTTLAEMGGYMEGKARRLQPDNFVEKPVDPAVLLRMARHLVGGARRG